MAPLGIEMAAVAISSQSPVALRTAGRRMRSPGGEREGCFYRVTLAENDKAGTALGADPRDLNPTANHAAPDSPAEGAGFEEDGKTCKRARSAGKGRMDSRRGFGEPHTRLRRFCSPHH